jgi:hypothetical protein
VNDERTKEPSDRVLAAKTVSTSEGAAPGARNAKTTTDAGAESDGSAEGRTIIGKASATERDPNSSERFSFWLAADEIVNPFDIVEANKMGETRTFGLVTNVKQITDAPSHLSNTSQAISEVHSLTRKPLGRVPTLPK